MMSNRHLAQYNLYVFRFLGKFPFRPSSLCISFKVYSGFSLISLDFLFKKKTSIREKHSDTKDDTVELKMSNFL